MHVDNEHDFEWGSKRWWEESDSPKNMVGGITQKEGGGPGNHSKSLRLRGWGESLKKRVGGITQKEGAMGGITLACEAHRVSLRHRELGR